MPNAAQIDKFKERAKNFPPADAFELVHEHKGTYFTGLCENGYWWYLSAGDFDNEIKVQNGPEDDPHIMTKETFIKRFDTGTMEAYFAIRMGIYDDHDE